MRPAEAALLGQGPRAADQSLCVQPVHEAVHRPAPGLLECQHPPLGLDHRGGGEARQQGWVPGDRIDGADLALHQLAPALQLRHRLVDLLGPCRAQRHLPGTLLEAPGGERGVTLGEDRCRLAHRAQRRLGCQQHGHAHAPGPARGHAPASGYALWLQPRSARDRARAGGPGPGPGCVAGPDRPRAWPRACARRPPRAAGPWPVPGSALARPGGPRRPWPGC